MVTKIDLGEIAVEVVKKDIKNIHLSVYPPAGRVRISAPLRMNLETIRVWIDKAAIRWGIDAVHREKIGLPAFAQNTWREGLDRLLLGYALAGGNRQLFQNILPCDEIEGGLAKTLGNFIEFSARIFETAQELETARTLGGTGRRERRANPMAGTIPVPWVSR